MTAGVVPVSSGRSFKFVPIMVGVLSIEMQALRHCIQRFHLSFTRESVVASVLSPYLEDPSNFFIISSDFCHWGVRFRYTPHNAEQASLFYFPDPGFVEQWIWQGPIWKYIEWLDREGIRAIEKVYFCQRFAVADAIMISRVIRQYSGNT